MRSWLVCPAVLIAAVRHRERPIPRDGRLQPVTLTLRRVFEIRNHLFRRVVIRIEQRPVALPDAFDAWHLRAAVVVDARRFLRAWRRTAESFARPVVDDHDARADRREKRRRASALQRAVPASLPDTDLADAIDRAHQLDFLLPIEIREIDELEI